MVFDDKLSFGRTFADQNFVGDKIGNRITKL